MTTWCQVKLPRKFLKARLTRAPHDFYVSVPKINTPRFLTMLIPVKYLTTGNIHRPGHNALRNTTWSTVIAFRFYEYVHLLEKWVKVEKEPLIGPLKTVSESSADLSFSWLQFCVTTYGLIKMCL